jgi:hypothetical protein
VHPYSNKEIKKLKRLCYLQQTGSNLVQEAPPYHKKTYGKMKEGIIEKLYPLCDQKL